MGDKFARQQNNPKEEHIAYKQMIKLCCYYTTKYDTKVYIRVGENMILNLIPSHTQTVQEVALDKPKLLIFRLTIYEISKRICL